VHHSASGSGSGSGSKMNTDKKLDDSEIENNDDVVFKLSDLIIKQPIIKKYFKICPLIK